MFDKTLRKLTGLNFIVFLLIFGSFTSVYYGYLSYRLFDKVDASMLLQASLFRIPNGRGGPPVRPSMFDPRIFLLLKSTDGRIINPNPFRAEEAGNVPEIASNVQPGKIQTVEYEGHVYRMVSVPYRYENNLLNGDRRFQLQEVIAVSIVDSEVELLHNLLWITLVSGVIGMAGMILAGYFLAKRAMVPIQAAWERQQQFVSDASHELRSPITGIYSNAELMLRHPEHTIEQESHRINTIMKESRRLTKLISSLLTLARSDANKAELQLAQVNISRLIDAVVESFQAIGEINKINIIGDIQPDLQLMADKDRLHQLFVILLDNAVKYTSAGGQVKISCEQLDKQVAVSVQDTGIGIASENLSRVFDRFFREDKSRSRDSGGTGLGLAIAKWIVESHRGKIWVESEPSKGTKFTILIPLSKK